MKEGMKEERTGKKKEREEAGSSCKSLLPHNFEEKN